jgi:hypothetical protein
MATTCAQRGMQVLVADLTLGARVARLLGAEGTGVQAVRVDNARLLTMVPELDEVAPTGPLRPSGGGPIAGPPDENLLAAYRGADLLVTIAELDPAVGSEHLATWATHAVAIVTAGLTPGVRVHAVGEMLRLSGVHVVSSVLVGADRTDESLGIDPADPELTMT